MNKVSTPRSTDWEAFHRNPDNTEVVITQAAHPDGHNYLTSLEASFDTTGSALLELFGLSGKVQFDGTDTSVVDLTDNDFTIAGHGLSDTTHDDKVVFHNGGGTTITGLTSGTSYFVVNVSGNTFQLSATSGGAAIDLSGTQANFGTELAIIPLSRSWQVYDQLQLDFSCPLKGAYDTEMIFKLGAVASVQGILNVAGYAL